MRVVSSIIAIILLLVHFNSSQENLPTSCVDGFTNSIIRNFYHIDSPHLYVNLLTFKTLSRIETQIGSAKYLMLLISIVVIASVLDYIVNLIFSLKCSIGFSGVLFGLLAWEMVTMHEFSPYVLLLLAINVISPTIRNPQSSLMGHGIGALAGVLSAYLLKGLGGNEISKNE